MIHDVIYALAMGGYGFSCVMIGWLEGRAKERRLWKSRLNGLGAANQAAQQQAAAQRPLTPDERQYALGQQDIGGRR